MVKLATEVFGDVVVVHAPEELGRDQAESLQTNLRALDRQRIVLDLDRTELLDSVGLTSLVDLGDELRAQGGELKIAASNPTNRKILEITRLDQVLEVYSSVLEAVKSFR